MLNRLNLHGVDISLLYIFEIGRLIAIVLFALSIFCLWLRLVKVDSFFFLMDLRQSDTCKLFLLVLLLYVGLRLRLARLVQGYLNYGLVLIHDLVDFLDLLNR
jgi:hypothetical protein